MTSKSPIKVLKEAYEVGKATFDDYSHEYSPRKFTQPQLFESVPDLLIKS